MAWFRRIHQATKCAKLPTRSLLEVASEDASPARWVAAASLRNYVGVGTPTSSTRRLAETVEAELVDDIYRCSFVRQTGVSLKFMLNFLSQPTEKNLLMSAQFLHKELPIRLAHRVAELENLPCGLSDKAPILTVRDWYVASFRDLRAVKSIQTPEEELAFTDVLKKIKTRHNNVVPMVSLGIAQYKAERQKAIDNMPLKARPVKVMVNGEYASGAASPDGKDELMRPQVYEFLDRIFLSRIGLRVLIGQHVALHDQFQPDHVGIVHCKMSPVSVARDAIEDARQICMRAYGDAPEVEVFGDPELTFAYIPSHLHHMLFELVKNSLRAVAEKYQNDTRLPPPIRVVIAEGAEDITIKVSDEGGGIPRSGIDNIFSYFYTTAEVPIDFIEQADSFTDGMPAVLAGYGYGLPISRLYARYFGGDLQVMSMDGYGTDAYLHLNRLGDSEEPLP